MKFQFKKYNDRKIEFHDLITINDWNVKVYTITNKNEFKSFRTLTAAIKEIPNWIEEIKKSEFELEIYNIAFLIVHEGIEGVWVLLNWWIDGEILETKVYFSHYKSPAIIADSIYSPKSLVCIWELEIIIHERKMWIEHVLMNPSKPNFKKYFQDTL